MARVGVRSSIGNMRFDAVLKTDHTQRLTMTNHPVEKGADITDHAFIEPAELSMEVAMSDVASGDGNSASTFNSLLSLQSKREPFPVVTRLKTYRNMMIEAISSPDDHTTMFGLKANIIMKELVIVETSTVKVSPRASSQPQKTGQTNSGTSQPQGASSGGGSSGSGSGSASKQSVLKQAANKLFGG